MARVHYRPRAILTPHPGFVERVVWRPYLPVRLRYASLESPTLEALVDSGSDICIFDASYGERLGIAPKGANPGGIAVLGRLYDAYSAEVTILGRDFSFQTKVLFAVDLPVGGLLGRKGFFDNFRITFDHSTEPPSIHYEEIRRA